MRAERYTHAALRMKVQGIFSGAYNNYGYRCVHAGVRYSITNPRAYIDSNIVGFFNVLEACRNHPVEHLLYASSSSVYGNQQKIPFSVDDDVSKPVSLYAATKKSNELMAFAYSHLYGIPTTGLRFFTVYGPYGRPDMAYFSFTDRMVKGETIKIFATATRNAIFPMWTILCGAWKTCCAILRKKRTPPRYTILETISRKACCASSRRWSSA